MGKDEEKDPIVIVGFSARLPQDATSAEGFWQMLKEGRSARTEIPSDRFNIDAFYHANPDRLDAMHLRHGNFIAEDLAAFDAPFFSIQPTEAHSMDPQQRLLLETSYRALENAGLSMHAVSNTRTGVFVGQNARDYETLLLRDPDQPAKYVGTGIGTSLMANRISWFFNLRGPSVALDTACSSSTVAFHLACQSIRSGETDMALVGGSNLILVPDIMIHMSNMGFLSPDGICYTFDHRANGYAKGEGVCFLVVKRLSHALQAGDCIRAVVRATGTNQDGRTPGLTMPSQQAQTDNILATYRDAGLDRETTALFEAHGTGTQVGDLLEAGAIHDAFRRGPANPLYLGTLKPNIGHCESASGIAALIKAVLTLEHGIIPPNIYFEKLNPSIPADEWNLRFPTELTPWPKTGVRRISLNGFGYGGSNAHVVLDDAYHYLTERNLRGYHHTNPTPHALTYHGSRRTGPDELTNGDAEPGPSPKILVWSSFDEAGVTRLANQYQTFLPGVDAATPADAAKFIDGLAYTLSNRRTILPWKSFVVADDLDDLRSSLRAGGSKVVRSSTAPTLLFVFTGQGAVWHAMGRELQAFPSYRASLKRAERALHDLGCEWSLTAELERDASTSTVESPERSQPLCTALQLALVDLLATWDVRPALVVGHSSGEIAAAYCAGALAFDSALKVAYYRGTLATTLAARRTADDAGAMTSIGLSEEAIAPYLARVMADGTTTVSVGCVNSPQNVTVTGDRQGVDALNAIVSAEGIFARTLAVNVAYHSHHMTPIAAEYLATLGELSPGDRTDRPSMFSSVTGARIELERLGEVQYWVDNMVSPVRFSEALSGALAHAAASLRLPGAKTVVLELGPHAALQRPVMDTVRSVQETDHVFYDGLLARDTSGLRSCLAAMGRLFCRGYPVDLAQVNRQTRRSRSPLADLPEYPFNHTQTYWQESRISRNHRFRERPRHELLGARSSDWNAAAPKWRNTLRIAELTWIAEHKYDHTVLFPAGGMLLLAIESLRQLVDPSVSGDVRGWVLQDVRFLSALLVSDDTAGTETQFHLLPKRYAGSIPVECEFALYSWSDNDWSRICDGTVAIDLADRAPVVDEAEVRDTFRTGAHRCRDAIGTKQFYHNINEYGYQFGPQFQKIRSLKYNDAHQATATIERRAPHAADDHNHDHDATLLHPTDLEGVLQLAIASVSRGSFSNIPLFVPIGLQRLWVSNHPTPPAGTTALDAFGQMTFRGYREAHFSILATDPQTRRPLIVADGFKATATDEASAAVRVSTVMNRCYHLEWKPDLQFLSPAYVGKYVTRFAGPILDDATVPEPDLLYLRDALTASSSPVVNGHRDKGPVPTINGKPSGEEKLLTPDKATDLWSLLDARDWAPLIRRGAHLAAGWLDLAAHRDPSLQILELRAGAGIGTQTLVDALTSSTGVHGTARFARYTCTDAPAGDSNENDDWIDRMRERFAAGSAPVEVQALNIESDVEAQGFASTDPYDVVVACGSTLQVVADLDDALRRIRSLLKTGETLLLVECISPQTGRATLAFGLPGSHGEKAPEKVLSLRSKQEWIDSLTHAGFSTPEFHTSDPASGQPCGLLIATAIELSNGINGGVSAPLSVSNHLIVTDPESALQRETARLLASRAAIPETQIVSLSQLPARVGGGKKDCVIFLPEMERPFLQEIGADDYRIFQEAVQTVGSILWVTKGCSETVSRPACGIVTGLGRNIGSETFDLRFIELALEEASSIAADATHISAVLRQVIDRPSAEHTDTEFREIDGVLHVGRVLDATEVNQTMHRKLTPQPAQPASLGDATRPLTLTLATAGHLDTLQFEETTSDVDDDAIPLGEEQVEIQVTAAGLCPRDVAIARGQLPGNALGIECAGTVRQAGRLAGYRPGERVCGVVTTTGGSALATVARAHAAAVMRIPATLSFVEAASIPVAFGTAVYALVHLGRVEARQSVLIHAGMESVGRAAIQIARRLDARVFVTVSRVDDRAVLAERAGIPADDVFWERDPSFVAALQRRIGGGPDVVLGSLGGGGDDARRASWSCIAPGGRFIALGVVDASTWKTLPVRPFTRNATLTALDFASTFSGQNVPRMTQTTERITAMMADGSLQVIEPLRRFSVSDIQEVFEYLRDEGGDHGGKVVIEMSGSAIVPIVPSQRPTYRFHADGTYVLAGGLGGLGRCMTEWMVRQGARHFLMLSRSGAASSAAQEFLAEMGARGINIQAPLCDITDEARVIAVLREHRVRMPPIRGCIQATMVLKSNLFLNMSHSDWHTVLGPKVQGSWNLHQHLPADLDFFVLLSSLAAVMGSRALANYAAAGTYQDALARHRVGRGQTGIALNLGSIMGVGVVAEADLFDMNQREGFQGVTKAELLALMELACDPAQPLVRGRPARAQLVTGLGYAETLPPARLQEFYWTRKPMFSVLRQISASRFAATATAAAGAGAVDHAVLIRAAASDADVVRIVLAALVAKLARLLFADEADIDPAKPIHAFGIDSLIGMEIRYWFATEFQAALAIFEILGAESLYVLAQTAAEQSKILGP